MKKQMLKKSLSLVIALLMLLSMVPVLNIFAMNSEIAETAESVTEDGLEYTFYWGEGLAITGYTGSSTSITIPKKEYIIDKGVFSDCTSLTSIAIPMGVGTINEYAFSGCESLSSIVIPSKVTNIYSYAFAWCDSLTDVFCSGTEEEWNAINIYDNNDDLINATIHFEYIYETEPTEPITTAPIVTEPITTEPTTDATEVITTEPIASEPTTLQPVAADPTETTVPNVIITDEDTNISVEGDVDAELVVSQVTSDKEISDIDLILVGEKVSKVFDITLQKDGEEVQPEGKVFVRIPAEDPDSKVYRMEADGTLTDMNAVYKDGYLIFTTEHFSLYVVAEPSEATPDEVIYFIGDANSDGKINVKDATQIQKAAASLVTLDGVQTLASDANGDEKVNVKDATAIQKFVAGIPVNTPIGEERKK